MTFSLSISAHFKGSRRAFVFSLQNTAGIGPVKMSVLDPNRATKVANDAILWFGDNRLKICENANKNRCSISSLDNNFDIPSALTPGSAERHNFLAGSKLFTPTDLEVFYLGMYLRSALSLVLSFL